MVRALVGARILVVGINYSPETTGIAPYTAALASSLVDAGGRVRVVTGVPHYPAWEVTDTRYRSGTRWEDRIEGIPVTRLAHYVPPKANLAGRMRMEFRFMSRAARVVAQTPADAIVAVTPSLAGAAAATLAARSRPVGIVVQDLTGVGAQESGSAGRRASAGIARGELAILRRADLIGVIAPRFGEVLIRQGIPHDRVRDLSNFTHVEPIDLDPVAARKRLGWPVAGTLVVHTGNMGRKQGLESVVAAARIAEEKGSDVTFLLVGAGNQRHAIEEMSRGLTKLRMVEPVSAEDYPLVLAAADLLLVNERGGVTEMSFPSKLTSYTSARRPIVAAVEPTGITGRALARDQAAELVTPGDPARLLAAVEALADDESRRTTLAAAARAMGDRRYGRAAAERRYVDFVAELLTPDPGV